MLERSVESVSILVRPGVQFISSIDLPTVRYVSGDIVRLGQCINNFMSNAAKFTKTGEVELAISEGVRSEEDCKVELRVKVRDTGIGMSPETLSSLFQPFSQVSSFILLRFSA